ncbi:Apoptosis 1 inhibitor [Trachymyrmex septentrionalis]|uniref:Apoptosis 1 inhibitor n=2 Tax=Trachymyrmex septentrionalis TaxID=34720 RepID=A0A195ERR7_9HYME|nr:Apoptosis 1 inhibitor [Trachymyrmex septentrionalis]
MLDYDAPNDPYIYRFESLRLNSFAMWRESFMNCKELAAAGFYYTEKKDTVKCFECQITLSNWKIGDNPKSEHQRWSGRCRFVRNVACGNVPIDADLNKIDMLPPRVDVCGLYGLKYMSHSFPDILVQHQIESYRNSISESKKVNQDSESKKITQDSGTKGCSVSSDEDIDITVFWNADTNAYFKAKLSDVLGSTDPTYASYERRLLSFATCTCDTIREKKKELAEAGFFYFSGLFESSDQTMCFYCGKCLRAWQPEDDPVKEHIKWYPQCKFIKKILAKKLKKRIQDHENETHENETHENETHENETHENETDENETDENETPTNATTTVC